MVIDLLIAGSAFFAILLVVLWTLSGAALPVDARVRALGSDLQHPDRLAATPFRVRVMAPLVESLGRRAAALLPGAFLRRTEQRLVLAGQPMSSTTFYALILGMSALFAGFYLLLVIASGVSSVLVLLPVLPLGFFGMYLPVFWLSSQAKSRKNAMIKGLPDSMDLLTICVEAGLGLDAAFFRVAEKQSGPFVDEIRQMLREIGLGKTRRDALLNLADRTDIDDVRSFANAVIQAEQLGTSIAGILRVQSQRLRVRRRQRAEQEARKAPVKMVFPLVFCLMPSLFIFILGPIVVKLVNYLTS